MNYETPALHDGAYSSFDFDRPDLTWPSPYSPDKPDLKPNSTLDHDPSHPNTCLEVTEAQMGVSMEPLRHGRNTFLSF